MKNINKFINRNRTLILRIIAVLILIILVLFVFKFISMLTRTTTDPELTTSFFIKNKDDKYAMFNDSGKKLTDFIYSSVESIYNGAVKVKDENDKVAILNEKGKYVVKPGKYKTIIQNGGIFKVEEKENVFSLLNSKGKKIINSKNFDIKSNSYLYSATIVLNKDKYDIYSYTGKKIYSFKVNKDKKDGEEIAPTASNFKEYVSVFYDGLTVIFNANTGKIIKKIKDSEQYCINNITEDGSIMALNTCITWYEKSDNVKSKLLINGKLKDKDGECDAIGLNGENLVCTKNEVTHLLDKNLNIVNSDLSMMTYKDAKNYALKSGNDVHILKNNKVIKKIDNAVLSDRGYTEYGIYLIYKDNEFIFYDYKGKELYDKKYKKAITFDSNGLARVSEDGENYYFINTKGKKVSDYIDASYQIGEYYIVTKDNKKGIMTKDGSVIIDVIYESAEIKVVNDDLFAFLKKGDDYMLINLKTKKETLKINVIPAFFDHYLKVDKDGKSIYYTYNGKKLYEE